VALARPVPYIGSGEPKCFVLEPGWSRFGG
jgi:hypothetical protein